MTNRRLLLGGSPALVPSGLISVGSIATIRSNGKYNSWPVGCNLGGADVLIAFTEGDSHHLDNSGRVIVQLSADDGGSFGSDIVAYDHASLWASVMGATKLSAANPHHPGRILLALWRDQWNVPGSGEAGYVYTDDPTGATGWSTWNDLTNAFTREAFAAGPFLELPDGDLIVPIEGSDTTTSVLNRSCHSLRSTDGGDTVGDETVVRDYATDSRPYYESRLYMAGHRLRAIHRCSSGSGNHYGQGSLDLGLTAGGWDTPALAFAGFAAPNIALVRPGVQLVATRKSADSSVIALTTRNGGRSFENETVVDATMYEMEYACPIPRSDGKTLLVYGSQPTSSTSVSNLKTALLQVA